MSDISALEPLSEYAPNRYEAKREEIEPARQLPDEEVQAQQVKSAREQQDFQTTVQNSQYTGKGGFIDHMI
ncbi:hypothetical protein [Pseudodesulfovibrio tunisiensis]|uniref:hypothetical protein n=1 Tax=Pseudodesulfovibrio tunisiensis TaxID=463192 RepID=UPI001FB2194B|nr:hypothetical protein [Pseudodesulfovibrio tunisiensis]